jgi:hypothetical protein
MKFLTRFFAAAITMITICAHASGLNSDYEGDIKTMLHAIVKREVQTQLDPPNGLYLVDTVDRYARMFDAHELLLKNIVYRTDTHLIRVTWASSDDRWVIKVAYKTSSDDLLHHSTYADRHRIVDLKFVYYEGETLKYMRIEPPSEQQTRQIQPADATHPAQMIIHGTKSYQLADTNTPQMCGFCHELAKTDGSPSGLFFPRYQSKQPTESVAPASLLPNPSRVFNFKDFKPMSSQQLASLGLPAMTDGARTQIVSQSILIKDRPDQSTPVEVHAPIIRTIFEMPELVEIFARDNQVNTCLVVDFDARTPFGGRAYVCADVADLKLHVHFKNPYLTSFANGSTVDYVKPFYDIPGAPR